jgi:hypothetical protein
MKKWSEYTEEQREKYRAKSREYKEKHRKRLNLISKEYMKTYHVTDEQKERKRLYSIEYRKKQRILNPPIVKIKKEILKNPKIQYSDLFISKAVLKHGTKYDYSLCNPINSKAKVEIICKTHGIFLQTANDHLRGYGCKKCAGHLINNLEEFVDKANEIHKNKYSYEKSVYLTSSKKLLITCPIHGDFLQSPLNHLHKKGCKNCSLESIWSYTKWEEKGKKSLFFDSFKLYYIKAYNEKELFYKVGKTFKKVKERLENFPYNYELLKEVIGSAKEISLLERKILNENFKNKYIPMKKFKGSNECFNQEVTKIWD